MSARDIPALPVHVRAEIEVPPWLHAIGAEPAFVGERLFAFGWLPTSAGTDANARAPALLEVSEGGAHPFVRIEHEGVNIAASRPVDLGGGRLGFGLQPAGLVARAVIVDAAGRELCRVAASAASSGVDVVARATEDGSLILGCSGRTRTGGVVCVTVEGERWRAPDVTLLGTSGSRLFLGRDRGFFAEAILAFDARTGQHLWLHPTTDSRRVRGAVGANDDTLFTVEQRSDRVGDDVLLAIDAATGLERWRRPLGDRVSSMRVRGRVLAFVLRARGVPRTVVLDAGGDLVSERERDVGPERFEILAVDHTHVVWVSPTELVCETLGGETAWRWPLPPEFVHRAAIRAACAHGRIALRHETKLFLLAEDS